MTQTTKLQDLEMLRNHIVKMDSGSGDAALLTWAINQIRRAKEIGLILKRSYSGAAGKQYGEELYHHDN